MRFRKRPKVVEAVAVSDALAGVPMPDWFMHRTRNGKLVITEYGIEIVIGSNTKYMSARDYIAYDLIQGVVYGVSQHTMAEDYEPAEGEKV